ncbi:hypothetical protein EC973_006500 [Apophysomyces ossiformis]|uniref:Myb-like domain-containing protein n=1 Tax=Apophysomyces ossiformis TaxID=679940 RepID=A0A8H7BV73_9FUNG|nr:hypothetical protein EC973_006500 [Apophysomyces ossiformis]
MTKIGCQPKPLEEPISQPSIRFPLTNNPLSTTSKIRAMFGYLTDEEIKEILMDCQNNEVHIGQYRWGFERQLNNITVYIQDEAMLRLITQTDYLTRIRNVVATKYPAPKLLPIAPKQPVEEKISKTTNTCTQPAQPKPLQESPPPTPKADPPVPKTPIKQTKEEPRKKQSHSVGRLALDDALKQVDKTKDPKQAFDGWSQARIRAYQMIDQNPNSYYYRFNAPGEEQRKGPWSETEKALFFSRLKEMGANTQWGIFSMAIPGRVGYQCSNFYRLLIETNQVQDPNYVLDEKGKAHYLFDKKSADGKVEKTFRKHSKHGSRQAQVFNPENRRTSGRRRKTDESDEDDPDGSGAFTMKLRTKSTKSRKKEIDAKPDEVLPGFIDPITQKPVRKPAISKYGHVMG